MRNYTKMSSYHDGDHESSTDPFGHGKALLRFFANDTRAWRQAIEVLYALDRDCFSLSPSFDGGGQCDDPRPRPIFL